MNNITSIEKLLFFMLDRINLSRYDERFIENISMLTQVTTNQVVLLHELITKYSRQLAKHELSSAALMDLPWDVEVIESSPKFTSGHIEIIDGMIYFKSPFNRKFIEEFRREDFNQFIFNGSTRRYEAPYNQYSLKILLKIATKYFKSINLCPIAQKLLQEIRSYERAKYWSPTLTTINGRLYIIATNENLDAALGDLELSTDIDTLAKLSAHGVTIDKKLYNDFNIVEHVACNQIATVEHVNIPDMIEALKILKCDVAYLFGMLSIVKKQIVYALTNAGIDYVDTNTPNHQINKKRNFPVLIRVRKSYMAMDQYKACKIINVVNSSPIEIK